MCRNIFKKIKDDLNDGFTHLINKRRLMPPVQMVYNSFTLNSTANSFKFAYRPNNCTCNMTPIGIRQNFADNNNVNFFKNYLHFCLALVHVRILNWKNLKLKKNKDVTINRVTEGSPPVTGSFDLQWNGQILTSKFCYMMINK